MSHCHVAGNNPPHTPQGSRNLPSNTQHRPALEGVVLIPPHTHTGLQQCTTSTIPSAALREDMELPPAGTGFIQNQSDEAFAGFPGGGSTPIRHTHTRPPTSLVSRPTVLPPWPRVDMQPALFISLLAPLHIDFFGSENCRLSVLTPRRYEQSYLRSKENVLFFDEL